MRLSFGVTCLFVSHAIAHGRKPALPSVPQSVEATEVPRVQALARAAEVSASSG